MLTTHAEALLDELAEVIKRHGPDPLYEVQAIDPVVGAALNQVRRYSTSKRWRAR